MNDILNPIWANPKVAAEMERAVLRERASRQFWEENLSDQMSYDEFHLRTELRHAVNGGRMHPDEANQTLRDYKANENDHSRRS